MNPLSRLKRDHTLLRSKLLLLQSAADMAPGTWLALRQACISLTKQLERHSEHEEQVLASCASVLNEDIEPNAINHWERLRSLRILKRLFADGEPMGSFEGVRRAVKAIAEGMEEEMARQEQHLFPKLVHILQEGAPLEVSVNSQPGHLLNEEMTVERTVHRYPATREVLERLCINPIVEAYECLDQVAWYHHMTPETLLAQLQEAIEPA